jgi:hypothetical protein
MSREPIVWTDRGIFVGWILQVLGGAAGAYAFILIGTMLASLL